MWAARDEAPTGFTFSDLVLSRIYEAADGFVQILRIERNDMRY